MSSRSARHDEVVERIVRDAAAAVQDSSQAALADLPDAVHQHRTAVRRLRSVLAAFRRSLDPAAVNRLRARYGEWGTQLGVVRDIEARADVAAAALQARGLEDDPAWRRLVEVDRAEYTLAHVRLVELAAEPRALERERLLHEFAVDPGVVDPGASARKRLRTVLAREVRRVQRAASSLDGSMHAQHDLRKAGRRLRYVGEAIAAADAQLFGRDVTRLAKAGEKVHDVLGSQRDLVLFAERARLERSRAARSGEPVRPYDDVIGDAEDAAERLSAKVDRAVERVQDAASRV